MPLDGVLWHDHFFPKAYAWNDERMDDIRCRYDACQTGEKTYVVYSAETDSVVATYNVRTAAIVEAQRLADLDYALGKGSQEPDPRGGSGG